MADDFEAGAHQAVMGADKLRTLLLNAMEFGPHSLSEDTYQIKARVKSIDSIVQKVAGKRDEGRKDYSVSSLRDIVGVRLLTLFQQDLLSLVERFSVFLEDFSKGPVRLFSGQSLSEVVEEVIVYKSRVSSEVYDTIYAFLDSYFRSRGFPENFVRLETKDTRYSSIHIVAWGQVYINRSRKVIPIEFQLRTAFEDVWGEIQHLLIYKNFFLQQRDDSKRRIEEGEKHLRTLKNILDSCSEAADNAFFLLRAESRSDTLASSSASTNALTALVGLEHVLPKGAGPDISHALSVIQSVYERLIALNKKYSGSHIEDGLQSILNVLQELDQKWRGSLQSDPVALGEYDYCVNMERGAALVWLSQVLKSETQEVGAADVQSASLTSSLEKLEEARRVYFNISANPQYAQDPVLNYRIGSIYRTLGQLDIAILYFEVAITAMREPKWRDKGSIFEVLVPRHYGYVLYLQQEPWRFGLSAVNVERPGFTTAGERIRSKIRANLKRAFQVTSPACCVEVRKTDIVNRDIKKELGLAYNNAIWYGAEFIGLGGNIDDLNDGIMPDQAKFTYEFYNRLYTYYDVNRLEGERVEAIETGLRASLHFDDKDRGRRWYAELKKRKDDAQTWNRLPEGLRTAMEATLTAAAQWLEIVE